jgi:phosphoribosylanthranilate isomerase
MTKVKICGITNLEDALLSTKFGADALGFNFYEKSPRYILPEKAREIIEQLPQGVLKVGVFVNESLEKIAEIARIAKLDALQLHGEETPEFARELKARTNLEIIKAFRVSPEFKPEDVLQYETDAILLDAYNPQEHGGTGETFDWWKFKDSFSKIPNLYLAGGLSSKNITYPIGLINPYAVDACSLLEFEKGKKDKVEVINFIKLAKIYKKEWTINSIYALLDFIHYRPVMNFSKVSITLLRTYLDGFNLALKLNGIIFDWKQFRPDEESLPETGFQGWIAQKFLGYTETPMGWNNIILEQANNDEEKAFDLFFALLEEFKLEKENLSNE